MIPSDIKYDGNATPPQWTDNAEQVIERGTHIRVKIKGIRGEVGQMYAIATIKEDYLGYVARLGLSFGGLPSYVVLTISQTTFRVRQATDSPVRLEVSGTGRPRTKRAWYGGLKWEHFLAFGGSKRMRSHALTYFYTDTQVALSGKQCAVCTCRIDVTKASILASKLVRGSA